MPGPVGPGTTEYCLAMNIDPTGLISIDPNDPVPFNSCIASKGGVICSPPDAVYVTYGGMYKFTYYLSATAPGTLALTINGLVDVSTIWTSGLVGWPVSGIGIISIPDGSTIQLISYLNINVMILNQGVDAWLLLEKLHD